MITLPVTQLQMAMSLLIAEVWILSDPLYTVKIGSDNYFSLAVAGVIGIFSIFLLVGIKYASNIGFKEEYVPLGRAAATKLEQKQNQF